MSEKSKTQYREVPENSSRAKPIARTLQDLNDQVKYRPPARAYRALGIDKRK